MTEPDVRTMSNMIAAQPCEEGLYLVRTTYAETDALNAQGQVWRLDWDLDREDPYRCTLDTNDTLTDIWASPLGRLWVTTARGMVWTTADVRWPPHTWKPLDFEIVDPRMAWKVTSLPKLSAKKSDPLVSTVWGVGDDHVFVGTYQGAIYVWDGTAWSEMSTGVTTGITRIHGIGPNNVWAVGERRVIIHFDGRTWNRVPYPDDDEPTDGLTGVRVLPSGEVIICGRGGRVLRGGASGFEIVAEGKASLYAVAHFRDRLVFAAGDAGVLELKGNRLGVLRDTFAAVGTFECRHWLLLIEPFQKEGPGVVVYEPGAETEWGASFLQE